MNALAFLNKNSDHCHPINLLNVDYCILVVSRILELKKHAQRGGFVQSCFVHVKIYIKHSKLSFDFLGYSFDDK